MLDMAANSGCEVLHKLTCPLCLSPDNVMNISVRYFKKVKTRTFSYQNAYRTIEHVSSEVSYPSKNIPTVTDNTRGRYSELPRLGIDA